MMLRRTGFKRASKESFLKYGNVRGYSPICKRDFDSQGEMRYGELLFARQQNGEIDSLEYQVAWPITINGVRIVTKRSIVDFRYFNLDTNEWEWCEFKGFPTDLWKLKKSLWSAGGPGLLTVVYPRKNKIEPYRFEWITPIHPDETYVYPERILEDGETTPDG